MCNSVARTLICTTRYTCTARRRQCVSPRAPVDMPLITTAALQKRLCALKFLFLRLDSNWSRTPCTQPSSSACSALVNGVTSAACARVRVYLDVGGFNCKRCLLLASNTSLPHIHAYAVTSITFKAHCGTYVCSPPSLNNLHTCLLMTMTWSSTTGVNPTSSWSKDSASRPSL